MKKLSSKLPAFFLFTCFLLLLVSCNKGGNDNKSTPPTLTTADASSITGNGATLGGSLTSEGSSPVRERGVCWGPFNNPTLNGSYQNMGEGTGSFSYPVTGLSPNTKYYARAYAKDANSEITYGNEINFTTGNVIDVTTTLATDILTKKAVLKGSSSSNSGENMYNRGFTWGTSPGVTISNNFATGTGGSGTYTASISNLQPNTTYYVKAYCYTNIGQIIYGNEISFKTTGYLGASGGYVFYDKGETTNGWRYMEAAPTNIDYNSSYSNGALWGCYNGFIGQTLPGLGEGPANTTKILAGCTAANCAARLCANYQVNGISGWFLPSQDELTLLYQSLLPLNQLGSFFQHWSSTQFSSQEAYMVYMDIMTNNIYSMADYKSNYMDVRPVRRF